MINKTRRRLRMEILDLPLRWRQKIILKRFTWSDFNKQKFAMYITLNTHVRCGAVPYGGENARTIFNLHFSFPLRFFWILCNDKNEITRLKKIFRLWKRFPFLSLFGNAINSAKTEKKGGMKKQRKLVPFWKIKGKEFDRNEQDKWNNCFPLIFIPLICS